MSDWLDLELAHRLGPVAAPEELWERIENGQRTAARVQRSPRPSLWRAWPVAALASLAMAATALWLAGARSPALDIRQLAAAGYQAGPLDLYSTDPAVVRSWLNRQAGLDVPLRPSAGIRLKGARVVRAGAAPVAAVEYRVGDDSATLLVARADPACPLPPHGSHASSWQARGQVYALACSNPERSAAACLLCHAL